MRKWYGRRKTKMATIMEMKQILPPNLLSEHHSNQYVCLKQKVRWTGHSFFITQSFPRGTGNKTLDDEQHIGMGGTNRERGPIWSTWDKTEKNSWKLTNGVLGHLVRLSEDVHIFAKTLLVYLKRIQWQCLWMSFADQVIQEFHANSIHLC